MINGKTKEVYFHQYCPRCLYKEAPEGEDPCNECLANPSNEYSHKPINFKTKTEDLDEV